LKYGGETINLSLMHELHKTCILISDNGIGVDSSSIEKMLTPFWRGDDVPAGGVGLGLPIAAGAIRQLNGKLHIVSRPEFEGMQLQFVFS
jgi:two-component system sensor histidine kinase TctE